MEIKVHDIVKFESIEHLEKSIPIPDWAIGSPASKNFAVVRRMPIMDNKVPIGLRGDTREQRFGTFIDKNNILEVITPPSLVNRIENFNNKPYYAALKSMKEQFEKMDILWGPTGSVGFELATSIKVTKKSSDIDLCIYMKQIQRELLMEIWRFLEGLNQRVDVQVEIASVGAFLLNDYVKHEKSGFIVRTPYGPQLCTTVDNQIHLLFTS